MEQMLFTGWDGLLRARRVLTETPVLEVDAARVEVVSSHLAPADLAALFTAAGIRLSLCSAYVMRAMA
jgi:hypothetical protein